MDEMKLLEEFRAAVAPPDRGRLAGARALMFEPAGAGHRGGRSALRPRRLVSWPRLALSGGIAAATAAAVAAAVIIPAGASGPRESGGFRLTAAMVLNRAADAELAQPAPHAGQYVYTKTLQVYYGPGTSALPATTELWQPVIQAGPGHGFTAGAGIGRTSPCRSLCDFALKPMRGMQGGAAITSYAGLEQLPAGRGALLPALAAAEQRMCTARPPAGLLGAQNPPGPYKAHTVPLPTGARHVAPVHYPSSRADREWIGVMNILDNVGIMPPRLGAALFRAAATIPGVFVIRNVANAAGVRGIAVARTMHWNGPLTDELIFNPRTYRYIGHVSPPFTSPYGKVGTKTALLAGTIVNTAPRFKNGTAYTTETPGECF